MCKILFSFLLVVGNPLKLAHDQRKGAEDEDTGVPRRLQGQEHSWTSGKIETGRGKPLGMKGWSGRSQSCPGTAESPVTHFSVYAVMSLLSLSDCLSHLLRVPNCSQPHKSSDLPTYMSCALQCCSQENGDVVTWGGMSPFAGPPVLFWWEYAGSWSHHIFWSFSQRAHSKPHCRVCRTKDPPFPEEACRVISERTVQVRLRR